MTKLLSGTEPKKDTFALLNFRRLDVLDLYNRFLNVLILSLIGLSDRPFNNLPELVCLLCQLVSNLPLLCGLIIRLYKIYYLITLFFFDIIVPLASVSSLALRVFSQFNSMF